MSAQLPVSGAPCILTGWSLTAVSGLDFHRAALPTTEDASGCRLTPSAQTLIDGVGGPDAIVRGRLEMVSGVQVSPRPVSGDITVRRGDAIDGDVVARGKADADGRFFIEVPAGTYRLTGTSPSVDDGQQLCSAAAAVVVTGGQTITDVDVSCDVK